MPVEVKRGQILLALISLLFIAYVLPGHATHERDHRFTISGTVRNGASFPGAPLANEEVVAQDAKTKKIMQRGVTDMEGKYSMVLHVHNADVGKLVLLQSAGITKQLVLEFEPSDVSTERRAQIDFVVFPSSTPKPTSSP